MKLFDIQHCNFSRGWLIVKMASKTVTRSIGMSCVGAFLFSNQNSINVCQTSKGPRNLFHAFRLWGRRY